MPRFFLDGLLVVKGYRDLTAFHLFNCAKRVMSPDASWDYITQINKRFIGLGDQQLRTYLSSVMQKTYFYGLTRLKKILTEELDLPIRFPAKGSGTKTTRQSAAQTKRNQAKAGRVTAKQRKQTSLDTLLAEIEALCSAGQRVRQISKAMVLETTKLSRATLYRHWEQALQVAQRKECPTLPELVTAVRESFYHLSLIRYQGPISACGKFVWDAPQTTVKAFDLSSLKESCLRERVSDPANPLWAAPPNAIPPD